MVYLDLIVLFYLQNPKNTFRKCLPKHLVSSFVCFWLVIWLVVCVGFAVLNCIPILLFACRQSSQPCGSSTCEVGRASSSATPSPTANHSRRLPSLKSSFFRSVTPTKYPWCWWATKLTWNSSARWVPILSISFCFFLLGHIVPSMAAFQGSYGEFWERSDAHDFSKKSWRFCGILC